MKLSVSVPDEMWEQALRPGESPSAVVQEGLKLLVATRGQPAQRALRRAGGSYYGSDDEGAVSYVEEVLEAVTMNAAAMRDGGYSVGVDVAKRIPWAQLENLRNEAYIRSELVRWSRDGDCELPEEVVQAVYDALSDFDMLDSGEPPTSPTLYDGVADALLDVYDAVRRRLAEPGFLPRPAGQDQVGSEVDER
jgi:hypothetical protein